MFILLPTKVNGSSLSDPLVQVHKMKKKYYIHVVFNKWDAGDAADVEIRAAGLC